MVVKIIVFLICIAAVFLNFRSEWILKTFMHEEKPPLEKVLALKYTALGLAVAAFIAVFLK